MARQQENTQKNRWQQWDRLTADVYAKPQINRGPRNGFEHMSAGR